MRRCPDEALASAGESSELSSKNPVSSATDHVSDPSGAQNMRIVGDVSNTITQLRSYYKLRRQASLENQASPPKSFIDVNELDSAYDQSQAVSHSSFRKSLRMVEMLGNIEWSTERFKTQSYCTGLSMIQDLTPTSNHSPSLISNDSPIESAPQESPGEMDLISWNEDQADSTSKITDLYNLSMASVKPDVQANGEIMALNSSSWTPFFLLVLLDFCFFFKKKKEKRGKECSRSWLVYWRLCIQFCVWTSTAFTCLLGRCSCQLIRWLLHEQEWTHHRATAQYNFPIPNQTSLVKALDPWTTRSSRRRRTTTTTIPTESFREMWATEVWISHLSTQLAVWRAPNLQAKTRDLLQAAPKYPETTTLQICYRMRSVYLRLSTKINNEIKLVYVTGRLCKIYVFEKMFTAATRLPLFSRVPRCTVIFTREIKLTLGLARTILSLNIFPQASTCWLTVNRS